MFLASKTVLVSVLVGLFSVHIDFQPVDACSNKLVLQRKIALLENVWIGSVWFGLV